MNRLHSVSLAVLTCAAAQTPPAPVVAPARGVQLPPGPAARAFAGVGPSTVAAQLPRCPSGGLETPEWRELAPWQIWAEAVRGEASATQPDPRRRATLAQIAIAQGRWDDAWDHFASTGGDPAVCAALLPRFLPGVPLGPGAPGSEANSGQGFSVGAGGIVAGLPDGVLLRPAAPPPSVPAAEVALGRAWIERREMRIDGLRIGAAELSMKVGLESDGIQIEFEHQGGAGAHVRVRLPDLADFEVRVAYVDWMRQEDLGAALEFDIAPGDEPHILFGRFRPRAIDWPTNLPAKSPRFLADNGLDFEFPPQAPDANIFKAASGGFGRILGLAVSENRFGSKPFGGVRIDLTDAGTARRKLLGMVTLTERFALRR